MTKALLRCVMPASFFPFYEHISRRLLRPCEETSISAMPKYSRLITISALDIYWTKDETLAVEIRIH